ncbi:MAG: glycoside hydrolase family 3 N-terminal domain-containing protein [Dehalococcoidia bacterium]
MPRPLLATALFLALSFIAVACADNDEQGVLNLAETTREEAANEPSDEAPEDLTPSPTPVSGCEPGAWSSVEELGRLFIATPGGTSLAQSEIDTLEAYRIGGVLVRSYNVANREQLRALLAEIHANGETLTLVDHEGGSVQLPGVEPRISSASTLGVGSVEETRAAAALVGADLKALGFDIDLAPVADVKAPGYNTVSSRSFGTDPAFVGLHVLAFAQGLRDAGLVPTVKHFPGYGKAVGDAHLQLTTVGTPAEELRAVDLPPFQAAVDAGLPMIMTSHLHYAWLDAEVRPATISPDIISGLLRGEMGFNGVVVTDSLGMGAITLTVGTGEGVVLALAAGADMMLLTANITEVPAFVQRVQEAVDTGRLPRERVEEALGRISALQRLARGGDATCLLPE